MSPSDLLIAYNCNTKNYFCQTFIGIKAYYCKKTLYEKIVSNLNLTEIMRIALECRQNDLSYPEIGRVLSRPQATVYEYIIKMRQGYAAIYEI